MAIFTPLYHNNYGYFAFFMLVSLDSDMIHNQLFETY